MEWGEAITRGTAQIAMACYLSRVLLDVAGWNSEAANSWKRGLWTLGCLALWLHVAAAFEFVHHWSHRDAVEATAEQTRRVTGWFWGGGVYVNYAFAAFWLLDVLSWWRQGTEAAHGSRGWFWLTQAVFGFLIFNATVVFGPSYWRYVAAGFFVAFLIASLRRRHPPAGVDSS